MMDKDVDLRWLEDGFAVAGQIDAALLATLRQAGITAIINNRPDGEQPGQPDDASLAAAARAEGIAWTHAPMSGGVSPEMLDAVDAASADAGAVLAFCRSGTRSAYLWALARARAGGDPDTLSSQAAAAGYDLAAVRPLMERLAAEAR
ncbi:uncharacterized protein (TIGR01244 family) [Sphingomonas jejuensis]|uniref:Uncharacterized protein (TIGR01244 family) n=1 Tax=Sphingomonas jejuensis TaxID=904715 RepID=A0ABX0XPS7_9SPHN|nr:TIGR01244 family sulfur transferase [Sphingomonas jejuensis]NJC34794.1 uncharacterized protein (TIGR01244 family) [Sphingomonas jejuensis]